MKEPQQLLADYRQLQQRLTQASDQALLPNLTLCGLQSEPAEILSGAGDVWDRVVEFAPDQGWFCFQSSAALFFTRADCQPAGILLYGEVCRGHDSLHIRPHPGGGWQLNQFTHLPDGTTHLMEEKAFLSADPSVAHIHYHRYWQCDAVLGSVPVVACFTGLSPREKQSPERAS